MRLRLFWEQTRLAAANRLQKLREAVQGIRGLSTVVSFFEGITSLGWALVAIGLGAMSVGWYFTWVEVTSIGIIFASVVLCALLWSVGRGGYEVSLGLERSRVTVGERALGELLVSNPTGRTLGATRVELQVGAGALPLPQGKLLPGRRTLKPSPSRPRGEASYLSDRHTPFVVMPSAWFAVHRPGQRVWICISTREP